MKYIIIICLFLSGCVGGYKATVNLNFGGTNHSSSNAVEATTDVPVSDVANGNTVTPGTF